MTTMNVLDKDGTPVAIEKPLAPGRAAANACRPVALSNEDFAAIDGIETAIASTNTKLDTLHTDLGTMDGHVDGLETAVASTNTKLDTLHTDLGTLGTQTTSAAILAKLIATPATEAKQDTANTSLSSIDTKLSTINGNVDGLETLITSSNTKLDTVHTDLASVDGHVDGLETLVTSSNTKLDTLHTDFGTIGGYLDTVEAKLQTIADDVVAATLTPPLPVGQITNKMFSDSTALTPKFAKIAVSSSGANTIIAAVTSKKIRVLSYLLNVNAAVNAKWQSHVTPTDLTGLLYCGAQGDGACAGFNPVGWFETVSGEALDLNLSGAVAVGGHITYIEV